MRATCYWLSCIMLSVISINAIATTEQYEPLIEVDYRPDPSTDEGGFWYKVDDIEKRLQTSPYLIRDEELNAYISQLVCKLAGQYCSNIRVHIIDNPHFNASMYPNGMMHVWSGLLLRVRNESELVAVLAHELAHYLRIHQITQWRNTRDGLAFTVFLDSILTMGFASLAHMGGAAAFSREHEKEADVYGVQLMTAQGYPASAAYKLWEYVAAEQEKDNSKGQRGGIYATHPNVASRIGYLKELAKEYEQFDSKLVIQDRLRERMVPLYVDLMKNVVALREYEQLEELIKRHREIGYPDGLIDYFEGEKHRLRDQDGDKEVAIASYNRAIESGDEMLPKTAYRELGYLHLKAENNAMALQSFEKYLALEPSASDKEMILFYTDTLKGQ